MTQPSIRTRLAAAMAARGLRQAQLSAASGVRQSHISKILRGRVWPTQRTAEALAKALGIEVADVLYLDTKRRTDPPATADAARAEAAALRERAERVVEVARLVAAAVDPSSDLLVDLEIAVLAYDDPGAAAALEAERG